MHTSKPPVPNAVFRAACAAPAWGGRIPQRVDRVPGQMWHDLSLAFCLMLVIEGIMPFLSPSGWRAMVLSVTGMSDRALRVAGLCAMVAGTALLYAIN